METENAHTRFNLLKKKTFFFSNDFIISLLRKSGMWPLLWALPTAQRYLTVASVSELCHPVISNCESQRFSLFKFQNR